MHVDGIPSANATKVPPDFSSGRLHVSISLHSAACALTGGYDLKSAPEFRGMASIDGYHPSVKSPISDTLVPQVRECLV